jgi:hypothetical protein
MNFIFTIVSNYREIIGTVSKYSSHLPPHSKYRVFTWLAYETIMRKPGLPPLEKKAPRQVKSMIERQVSLFIGYMVLFAHDDAVDKFNLSSKQIYEQLSRYLSSFLLGFSIGEEAATSAKLSQELSKWSSKVRKKLSDYPHMVTELSYLFSLPKNLRNFYDNEKITVQNLLFKDEYEEPCRDWINTSIVSSMGMGRAFHKILLILRQHWGENEINQRRRSVFFMVLLVRCMYAQAHSPEQKDLDFISYGRFVEISYLKSTLLLDLYHYVSDQVNEKRFFATRHNESRACDQILDDLQDCEEDTADQILSILHIHILEQSRMAEKFLSIPNRRKITIATVEELISETEILRTTYDETFIYRNPYIRAERDSGGNLVIKTENAEIILREMWVNSASEVDWPIEELAKHRLWLGERLKDAWQSKDTRSVLDIIHISNFPIALTKSLSYFTSHKRKVIINAYAKHGALRAGYISYFVFMLSLKALLGKYLIKRMFSVFTIRMSRSSRSRRGIHERSSSS